MNLVSMPKSPFMKKALICQQYNGGGGPITYQFILYCTGLPHVEKCKMASSKWQLLTEEEKKNYEVTSKNMKSVNVNKLNDEQKSKLID